MQSEVPSLPVVCSDKQIRLSRKFSQESASASAEIKNNTTLCKTSAQASRKKVYQPLIDSPYRHRGNFTFLSQPKKVNKNTVGQRVISAKMLRIKQLQNQLTDAHFHLNELSNENKWLKATQKKQESALQRYEGANADIPRIINSHQEELRVLQVKYKRLREQHKHTCDMLKEKENELHSAQSLNKRLLQLSKDRNLGEREKLQAQVSDLNLQIQQHQETIQTLNRKLVLESKSVKQQLHIEITKHRETQRQLQETIEKLRSLEELLDNRERRLYYSNQLNIFTKGKSIGSYPITNFGDSSGSLYISKPLSGIKKAENEIYDKSLPHLIHLESNDKKGYSKISPHEISSLSISDELIPKTETMTSLQHIRKFRLPKARSRINSASAQNSHCQNETDSSSNLNKSNDNKSSDFKQDSVELQKKNDEDDLSKTVIDNYKYSNIDAHVESSEANTGKILHPDIFTKKSRELHARLTSETSASTNTLNETLQSRTSPHVLYNDVQKIVQEELKLGQESVVAMMENEKMFAVINDSESCSSFEEVSNDSSGELDTKSQDNLFSLKKINNNSNDNILSNSCSQNELPENSYNKPNISLCTTKRYENTVETKAILDDNERSRHNLQSIPECKSNESLTNTKFLKSADTNKEEDPVPISDSLEESQKNNADVSVLQEASILQNSNDMSEKLLNDLFESDSHTKIVSLEDANKPQCSMKENEKTSSIIKITDIRNVKSRDKLDIYLETKRTEYSEINNTDNNIVADSKRRASLDKQSQKLEEEIESKETKESTGFNKDKLLAAMKAIDDNENIEFCEQKSRRNSATNSNRSQITEHLYRGIPTHLKKKDVINGIFEDRKLESKLRDSNCDYEKFD